MFSWNDPASRAGSNHFGGTMKRVPLPGGTAVADPTPIVAALDKRQLLRALQHVRGGDFTVQLPGDWTGIDGEIAETFNEIIAANRKIAVELQRIGQAVGREGRTRERAKFDLPRGAWGEMESSFNTLVDDLLRPTTEVTQAIASV